MVLGNSEDPLEFCRGPPELTETHRFPRGWKKLFLKQLRERGHYNRHSREALNKRVLKKKKKKPVLFFGGKVQTVRVLRGTSWEGTEL